jgi:hypothetical protein
LEQPKTVAVSAICFPHDDMTLVQRVQRVLDRWANDEIGATPEAVMDELRDWYPRLAISVRQPIADLWGASDPTWYVYRDGSLLSSSAPEATTA